jgi:hypothetical protein
MARCRVELEALDKALENYTTKYEEATAKLKVEFESFKEHYKFSWLDKLLGKHKLSGKQLWYDKVDGWFHPSYYFLSDDEHLLFVFMREEIPAKLLAAVQSGSDAIYISGRETEFYVKYKGE